MAIDRRRAKRYVVVDLDLHDRETEQAVGKVVNISDGGLFALADTAYTIGEVCPFYIPVGPDEEHPERILFTAWVIWSHPNRLHPQKYSLGLEIVEGSEGLKFLMEQTSEA